MRSDVGFMRGVVAVWCLVAGLAAGEPIRVCATVPDLADLVRQIGGDRVSVTAFVPGPDDPHHLDARPSQVAALARAALLVEVGNELEIGWLPAVVDQARNPGLQRLVAADQIQILGVPDRPVDRSMGDVHASGNPHFLVDPWCGLQVARAIADRLGVMTGDPAAMQAAYQRLEGAVFQRLAGDLDPQVVRAALIAGDVPAGAGGWFARLAGLRGAELIADHDVWPYLARRYGFRVRHHLEPLPGVPPTQRHLASVVANAAGIRAILAVPYIDRRHAQQVATATGVPVLVMPHQVGATAEAPDWLHLLDVHASALATVAAQP
jgi:zinc/manganese transport system substrate-binding protein